LLDPPTFIAKSLNAPVMNERQNSPATTPDVSILMPVYNEIGSIGAILDIVKVSLPGVTKEIVIVDDGSSDGTRDWLAGKFPLVGNESAIGTSGVPVNAMSSECSIRVIFHSRNKGKGGAIQTAMRAATGAVLVIQDADLEYDPDDWKVMYALISDKKVADVVYGSRFYGKPHRSLYFHHYLANRLISLLFNLLCNQTLTDIETCYKMFTREVLATLNITANDFGIEVQISMQIALARRWRIYETGIHYYGRTYQEGKKINWRDGLKALWYLIRYRVNPGN
jgi:glycosyltransferase involved in cell wall biosynthesis